MKFERQEENLSTINAMKTIRIILIFLVIMPTCIYGQVDLKTDLISSLMMRPNVEAELIIGENYGLGVAGFVDFGHVFLEKDVKKSGYRLMAIGRRYFNPVKAGDKWYAGLYAGSRAKEYSEIASDGTDLGYSFSQFLVGLNLGRKWLVASKIILDIDLGLGRTFGSGPMYNDPDAAERIFDRAFDYDGWLRISLGYRLGK